MGDIRRNQHLGYRGYFVTSVMVISSNYGACNCFADRSYRVCKRARIRRPTAAYATLGVGMATLDNAASSVEATSYLVEDPAPWEASRAFVKSRDWASARQED